SRRFAAARVNSILAQSFKGKVVIRRVGFLHLTTLGGIDGEVLDPEGKRVLEVYGARVRIGTISLLRSLARGGVLDVHAPELLLDGAEVVLEDDAAGEIGLVRAFEPREPSTEPGRGVHVTISKIRLPHAWVHGHLASVPVIDADLDDLAGAFESTPDTTRIQ